MENASKALIIAGAILLSIAIIGIGMSVFNGAQDAVNKANMDEATINAFNGKFETYVGTNKSGSDVKNLIQTMITHNNSNIDDPSMQVKLTSTGGTINGSVDTTPAEGRITIPGTAKGLIRSGRTYRVHVDYSVATGLICNIDISIRNTAGTDYEAITGIASTEANN